MTLGIGTLSTRTRQPVRVINAVYPVQTRAQRRLLARNAGSCRPSGRAWCRACHNRLRRV